MLSLPADSYLLWGLTMCEAFYNRKTMVTHSSGEDGASSTTVPCTTGIGWTWCRAINSTDLGECKQMSKSTSRALGDDVRPRFPSVADGQCGHIRRLPPPGKFARTRYSADDVSRRAHAHAARGGATSRRHGPKKSSFACWPLQDSMLGYWISKISLERGTHIHLANSPFMVQHHPWPSDGHGAFSNASVMRARFRSDRVRIAEVVAFATGSRALGLSFRSNAPRGDCASMGWSTWPESHIHRRTCCGDQAPKAEQSPAQQKGRRRRAKRAGGSAPYALPRNAMQPTISNGNRHTFHRPSPTITHAAPGTDWPAASPR